MLLPSQLKSSLFKVSEETCPIFFSSVLSECYYDELEALMFFNPQQIKLKNTVSQLVERYGNPRIVNQQGRLWLEIGSSFLAQTLFCFDGSTQRNLIGVVVYIRECIEDLTIIHLCVREDYSISGCYADQFLVLHLMQKIQEIGTRLKGVKTIKVLYNQSLKQIPVRHGEH